VPKSTHQEPKEPSWLRIVLPAIVQGLIRVAADVLLGREGKGL
jgi:hypothetical protein